MNRIETLGVNIAQEFHAYYMLTCANLSQTKKEICQATCSTLTPKAMRAQIEKVGADLDTGSSNHQQACSSKSDFSVIKTEPVAETMYVQSCLQCGNDTYLSSGDDDANLCDTFYTNRGRMSRSFPRGSGSHQIQSNQNFKDAAPTRNPTNKFGHLTDCDFCKSIYHYLPDCPDCPQQIKLQYA